MSTFDRVALWNTVCGKVAPEFGTEEYLATLENQASRIQEELDELVLAVTIAKAVTLNMDSVTRDSVYVNGKEYSCTQEELSIQHQEILDAGFRCSCCWAKLLVRSCLLSCNRRSFGQQ